MPVAKQVRTGCDAGFSVHQKNYASRVDLGLTRATVVKDLQPVYRRTIRYRVKPLCRGTFGTHSVEIAANGEAIRISSGSRADLLEPSKTRRATQIESICTSPIISSA